MKIFLDDFTVYNDEDIHLQKLKLYFQKCKEYGINLNPDKCTFMVFSGMILGFIVMHPKLFDRLNCGSKVKQWKDKELGYAP
jgi:hypothetical protein